MKRIAAGLLLALPFAFAVHAADATVPPQAQVEIDHLLDYISKSGCRFDRNGSWHDMAAARSHVTMKYEYLKERGEIQSAESFIDGAASRSSFSGKDYRVQCPGADPVSSAAWLKSELTHFRQAQLKG